MTQHVILSAIGSDRPGLVDEVSECIFQRGGNIEDSRMVNLRGQFAIMILVAGAPEALERMRSEAWQLSQKSGLAAEVRQATAVNVGASAETMPYRLTATAIDQPGLVHRFSHLLREMRVNIESLDTKLAAAPITGTPLFEMEMVLSVPRSTSISKLRETLGKLAEEINIDWELKAG